MALVAGFGGMRAGMGQLSFSPQLPPGLAELRFRMRYRGRTLRVTIAHSRAKYELLDGDPLALLHQGKKFQLGHRAVEHDIMPVKAGPRPEQPPGRAPYNRSAS